MKKTNNDWVVMIFIGSGRKKLKQRTWLLIVFARLLPFLAALIVHYARQP